MTASDGQVISYAYGGTTAGARLITVTYPGSVSGTVSKTYFYENAVFPQLLTGISDETGKRYATINYDSQGRGTSSGYAGGADLYSISYGSGGAATVTDPLGTQRTYSYGTSKGKLIVTSADKPNGTGAPSVASRVQDANGFVTQETDFLGVNTMFTWDINRRLPLSTTRAQGLPEVQSTSTQWHAIFRLPTLVTEAGRTTAYTYDTLGNMLTRTVTDTATSVSRTTSWTYVGTGITQGLPLTQTDPKGAVTRTYAYYGSSTFTSAVQFDPNFSSISLLLHGDGVDGAVSISDSSGSPKSITVGTNARISTAQSKFGGSALYFPGSASLAVAGLSGTTFWASDWTVEFWAATAVPAQGVGAVFGNRDAGGAGMGGGQLYLSYSAGVLTGINFEVAESSTWGGFGVGMSTPGFASARVASGFDHIAVTKQGLTYAFFLNGVKLDSITRTVPAMNSPSPLIYVGAANRNAFVPYFFNGYVDDFRITMGAPRYANNFVPPLTAFPDTAAMPIDPNEVGQTAGDLQSITNAAGHVTQFTQYDRAGRVRQMIDPKGVVTDMLYTPRGWVSSVNVTPPGGVARTSTYSYDNVGQLTSVVHADGSTMSYSYDAAHRLTGVTDARGNSVTYTLDAMGNKTGEQVKDPQGNLQRNITRVYDALNRVQQVTGASN